MDKLAEWPCDMWVIGKNIPEMEKVATIIGTDNSLVEMFAAYHRE